ncbi:MAG: hypothetical protein ACK50E_07665 [Bacteroidota bacterium]
MKRTLFLAIMFSMALINAKAQKVSDLFGSSSTKIIWLGIDFSHARLFGDFAQFAEAGSTGPLVLKNKFFPAWNELVLSEPKKYDVAGMFRKENMLYKINTITKINSNAPIEDLMDAENEPDYKKEDIQKFIKSYDFDEKQGIGLMFVAESMNKYREMGKYHFVAINLSNKEILLHDVFEGKAGGFGLRNYWARSFYEVILQIRDQQYKIWKREYGN